MSRPRRHLRSLAWALPCVALIGASRTTAQPVLDAVLSDAQVVSQNGCAIVKINFNVRIRYAHHFPIDHGSELSISVNAIDRTQLIAMQLLRRKREALRPPDSAVAAIKAIDFETRPAIGPVLSIHFDHPVWYQVSQSADIQSIVIAISGTRPNPACRGEFFAPGAPGVRPVVVPNRAGAAGPAASAPPSRPAGRISEADLRVVAAAMDEARAALKQSNYKGAIALLTKALHYPENEYSAEAQELLGFAHQRNGQVDAARADYEDYLRRYPGGEGHDRVQQRLAGLVTAAGEPDAALRAPARFGTKPLGSQFQPGSATQWTFSGSISQFYIRDDSFQVARDVSAAPNPNDEADAHQVHQNEMLTSIDLMATWINADTRGKIRFSGTNELLFDSGDSDRFGLAALFGEMEIKDWNVFARVGRQVRNTDGVLGRFDGALVSWQALPFTKFSVVAGSQVLSRFDQPFRDDKWFTGVSADFGPFLGGLEASIYAIDQRDRWLLDRQAVGAEFRYFDLTKTGFATIDYDIHFQQLNAAIISGSWTLADKSTLYGGADYRKTPFLSTWNALLNQPFVTIYDMMRLQTNEQLQQLAVNATPTYKSAMIGYSRPLNDHFQVSGDVTVVNLTQPLVASVVDPGLPTLPAGNEYYYSTQVMGANLVKEGDMYIVGLRYSQLLDSNMWVVDFNTRYPWSKELALSPRLRFGYRAGRGIDLKEYTALPSVLVDYYWSRQLSFEAEIGWQQTWGEQAGIRDNNVDLFLTFGVRWDFDAETRTSDKRDCATPVAQALCRYSKGAQEGSCASPPPGCH